MPCNMTFASDVLDMFGCRYLSAGGTSGTLQCTELLPGLSCLM